MTKLKMYKEIIKRNGKCPPVPCTECVFFDKSLICKYLIPPFISMNKIERRLHRLNFTKRAIKLKIINKILK